MPEAHDHYGGDAVPEIAALAHRCRHFVVPAAAVASLLTSLHDYGLAFSIGAVVTWLLYLLLSFVAAAHDWKICSHCTRPPRAQATLQTRARMARRHHSPVSRIGLLFLLLLVLAHAIMPKPYMGPWWTEAVAGCCYFLVAAVFAGFQIRVWQHEQYRDECYLKSCRAGLRPRGRQQLWMAHFGVWVIAALAPAACILGLFTAGHPDTALRIVYGVVLAVMLWAFLDVTLVHTDSPCVYCGRNLPDNPERTAEQRARWLWLFHHTRVGVLSGAAIGWITSWVLAGTAAAKVLVCFSAAGLVVWAVLDRVHGPLKPWCEWCRDDGDTDAETDVPDPADCAPSPT